MIHTADIVFSLVMSARSVYFLPLSLLLTTADMDILPVSWASPAAAFLSLLLSLSLIHI